MNSNTGTYTDNINTKSKDDYSFYLNAAKYSVIIGGLITLFFFALQIIGMGDAIGMKYMGYGILGLILARALRDYENYLKTGTTFKNGMLLGAQVTLMTGAAMVFINAIAFLTGSGIGFSKYGIESTNFPELLMLSGAIFLEIVVTGVIFTFIILQYLKSRKDYKS